MPRKALTDEFERFVRNAYHMSGDTLLDKVEKGESGGRGGAVSKAGARGWMQFMPATRQAVLNYTGGKIDPWRSEGEAREAAKLHLLGKLGNRRGLGGYNPGDSSYPSYILHQQVAGSGSPSKGSDSRSDGTRRETTSRTIPGVDRSKERKALILQFLQQRHRPGSVVSLATGLDANKDTPSRTVKSTRVVKGSASGTKVASGHSPVAGDGKIIGTPYKGTHTLGNWQSDNADDIGVAAGTPMVAVQDGVVEKVRHHPQGSGRFAGDQITIRGANGNEYFYAHGVAHVRPGQRVRKGQKLGVTGSANGVEHLHYAQRRGNPAFHAGR